MNGTKKQPFQKRFFWINNAEQMSQKSLSSFLQKTESTKKTSWLKGRKGPLHPSYKHGQGKSRDYDSEQYAVWKQGVLRQFSFKCFLTGKTTHLEAHHLLGWWNEATRYDIQNGVALAADVHKEFHDHYGRGANTPEQFEEFCRERYNVTFFPWRYGNQQPSLSETEKNRIELLASQKKTEFEALVSQRGHQILEGEYKNNASSLLIFCPKHGFQQRIQKAGNYKKSKFGLSCCAKEKQSKTTSDSNKRRRKNTSQK